jgi:hypothetical protein
MFVKAILEAKKRVPKAADSTATAPTNLLDGERQLVLELNSVAETIVYIDVRYRV